MIQLLPLIAVPLTLAVLYLTVKRELALEALPSLFWTFSAVLPYLYLRQFFPVASADKQAIGLFIITIALAGSDIFASNIIKAHQDARANAINNPNLLAKYMPWVLIALFAYLIILPVLHLSLQHNAPIFTRLFGPPGSDLQLSTEREHFSKLLAVPTVLKFMFNWVLVVVAPVLIILLLFSRKALWAILAFIWAAIYAVLSLAKFPIVILSYICLISYFRMQHVNKQRIFILIMTAVAIIWLAVGIVRGNQYEVWYKNLDKSSIPEGLWQRISSESSPLTPGDIDRMQGFGTTLIVPSTFGKSIDSLVCRSVLVPMEVSNRWYQYFPHISGGYRPMSDMLPLHRDRAWVHPAHAVAQWGYRRIFPGVYTDTTSAYASIDADAYAHGGIMSIAVVAFLFAGLRVLLAYFSGPDILSATVYSCAIAAISILPFQASIQAMLIPQGVILFLAFLYVWHRLNRRFNRVNLILMGNRN